MPIAEWNASAMLAKPLSYFQIFGFDSKLII